MTKKYAKIIIVLIIIRDRAAITPLPLRFVGNSSTYEAKAKGGTTGRRPAQQEGKSGSARWIPCHCLGGWW